MFHYACGVFEPMFHSEGLFVNLCFTLRAYFDIVFHFRPKPKLEKHLALGRIPKPKVQIYVKIGGILLKFIVSNDLSN